LQEPLAERPEALAVAPLANDGGDDDAVAGDDLELPSLEYDPFFPDDDEPDEIVVDSWDSLEEEEPTSDLPVEVDAVHHTSSGPVDPSTLDTLPFEPNGIVPSSPDVPGDSQPMPSGVSLWSCRVDPVRASDSEVEERIRFLQ